MELFTFHGFGHVTSNWLVEQYLEKLLGHIP
jgi:hypothetical protein